MRKCKNIDVSNHVLNVCGRTIFAIPYCTTSIYTLTHPQIHLLPLYWPKAVYYVHHFIIWVHTVYGHACTGSGLFCRYHSLAKGIRHYTGLHRSTCHHSCWTEILNKTWPHYLDNVVLLSHHLATPIKSSNVGTSHADTRPYLSNALEIFAYHIDRSYALEMLFTKFANI